MAISSIERYIFVFHRIYYVRYSLLSFRISTFTSILIPTAWYTGFIFFYPCTNRPSYINFQCGALCYISSSPTVNQVENYAYLILPILIIVFTNSLLVFQVLIEKRRVTRNDGMRLWRKNVRMISQLFSVAILYICVYIPSVVLVFIIIFSSNSQTRAWAIRTRVSYFYHLKYLVIFGCPFMVLASQTKMHEKIKRFIRFCCLQQQGRNTNQVIPLTTMKPSFIGRQRLTTNK
ncbi:unnamed protein product [Adineta steineri]|nr:unnamed protein product [Adineta steineri]CAF1358852.1 unnamed protein product [Adineta steineri]CAF1486990.1 unnamed protein product [Adineta steineri]